MSYIDNRGFDHGTCEGRNLPPCGVDAGHGHAAMFVGATIVHKVSGEERDRVFFLCKDCMMRHMVHQQLGPLAVLVAGPPPINSDDMFERGLTPDDAEKALLDVIAQFPDDESPKRLLDEFRTTRAMVEAQKANEEAHGEGVTIVQPMNAREFGRLMAGSPKGIYPESEEVN